MTIKQLKDSVRDSIWVSAKIEAGQEIRFSIQTSIHDALSSPIWAQIYLEVDSSANPCTTIFTRS